MSARLSSPYDLAVVGGGIFGLSIAYQALREGLSVVVIEKDQIGAGASGGLLGALMPHMPARWNPKKEFQFQSLMRLERHVRTLERDTGVSTGYKRCGRILPLTTQDKLDHHLERAAEAEQRWQPATTGFTYQVEPPASRADWLSPAAAPFGIVYETLAGRIAPRAYLSALAAYIREHGTLLEGACFEAFNEATGAVSVSGRFSHSFSGDLSGLQAERLVLASGPRSFDHLEALTGERIGRGEKGQALIVDGAGLEELPAIYCDGLYVVPHGDGTVAIGSTSDRHFESDAVDPARTEELIGRATAFCPRLQGRNILTAWAGIRPRCNKRDALVGKIPGHDRIFTATGGFKISYGIAHLVAEALVCELTGKPPSVELPPSYRPDAHFTD